MMRLIAQATSLKTVLVVIIDPFRLCCIDGRLNKIEKSNTNRTDCKWPREGLRMGIHQDFNVYAPVWNREELAPRYRVVLYVKSGTDEDGNAIFTETVGDGYKPGGLPLRLKENALRDSLTIKVYELAGIIDFEDITWPRGSFSADRMEVFDSRFDKPLYEQNFCRTQTCEDGPFSIRFPETQEIV